MSGETLQPGIRLYQSKRYEAALALFLALDLDPAEEPELAYYLGLCYTKLEKYDDALLYLEQVVTNHTNLILIYQSRMILSYIYCVTERFRLAEFEVKQLLEGGYESPQVYSAYSYIHYMMGRHKECVNALEKALELDPENANSLNSLGYVLAEMGDDLDRAIGYCRRAVKINPNSYAYLDSLGWAYFKAGRYGEAREYLRKAMEISRGSKVVAHHMRELISLNEPY